MEKPLLDVERFQGMHTSLDQAHIGDTELANAENVSWDNEGIIRNRQGVIVQAWNAIDFTSRAAYITELQTWSDVYFGGIVYPPNTVTDKSDTVSARLFLLVGIGGNDPKLSVFGDRINTWVNYEQLTNGHNVSQIPGIVYNLSGTQWIYMSDGIKLKWSDHFGAGINTWTPPVNVRVGAFVLHQDRFFMADKWNLITNRLFFSAPGDPENWAAPDGGFFDIGNEDGGRITCAVSYQDALYVFKTGSIWVLHTPGPTYNWTLRKVSDLGCWGQTAVSHQGALYFAGPDGVFRWQGNSGTKLSDPIQDLITPTSELRGEIAPVDGNWGALPVAPLFQHGEKASPRACAYRNSYWLLTFNRQGNTMLFEYNIKFNAWSRHIISGYNMDDVMDIYAIPDDIQGVKIDSSSAQPGVYVAIRNQSQKAMLAVKLANNNWVDQYIKYQGVSLINANLREIHTNLTIPEQLAGQYVTSASNGITYNILYNTPGINSVLTVDQDFTGGDVSQISYFIWDKKPYTSKIKTKLWDFGNPNSFKKIKRIVVRALFRNLKVDVVSNDDVSAIQYMSEGNNVLVSTEQNLADKHENQYSGQGFDQYRTIILPGGFRAPNMALEITSVNDYDHTPGVEYPYSPPGQFFGDFKLFGVQIFGRDKSSVGENTLHTDTVRS